MTKIAGLLSNALFATLVLCCSFARADHSLEVSGDYEIVVKKLPVTLTATAGADYYIWNYSGLVEVGATNTFTLKAGTGSIRVVCVMVTTDAPKGMAVKVASVDLAIGQPTPPGPGPDPGPGPGPIPPGPTPVVPDGANGLTKWAYTEAMKIHDRSKAGELGNNFTSVGSQLAAGGYLSIAAANADLKERNRSTLGASRELWLTWASAQAEQMAALKTAGKAVTEQQVADCYAAIGAGLKLVK